MREIKIIRGEGLSTIEIIKAVARSPGDKGVSYDEMRNRLRILDAAEAVDEDATLIELEDADYNLLARLTKEFRFGLVRKELVDVIEEILNAAKITPKKNGSRGEAGDRPAAD